MKKLSKWLSGTLITGAVVFLCLPTPQALASAWEYIGFDSETIGGGNALIGGASGAAALFYNPAGLIRGHRRLSDVSLLAALPLLSMKVDKNSSLENVAGLTPIDGVGACDENKFPDSQDIAADRSACLDSVAKYNRYINSGKHHLDLNRELVDAAANPRSVYGATIGMVLPLHLDPKLAFVSVGVAAFVPFGPIMYQRIKSPTVPFFLRFDDGPHRIVINLGGAVELPKGIRLGFGVDALVDLAAAVNANVIIPPVLSVLPEPNLQDIRFVADGVIEIPPSFSPIAGIQYEPLDWLSIGLVYRHEHKVDMVLDGSFVVRTGVLEPDRIPISVATSGTFTPSSVGGGVSVKPMEGLTVNLDASWKRWSTYEPPFSVDLQVSGLGGNMACNILDTVEGLDSLLDGLPTVITDLFPPDENGKPDLCGLVNDLLPQSINTNTYESKSKFSDIVELNTGVQYSFMRYMVEAGYSFQPSPVPPQTGIYNILDADSHVFSSGAFATVKGIKFGVVGQYRMLVKTVTVKNNGAQEIAGQDDFAGVEQDVFPGTTFNTIPGHQDELDTLASDTYTGNTEYANPGYPGYTISGGYLTLGVQASIDF